MKIRQGFVSNSSTTSFCIYGACISDMSTEDEEMYEIVEAAGLDCHCPEGSSGYYVGRSWSSVGDDETGKQFKESVQQAIKELTGKEEKCRTYKEAWYS